MIAKGELVLAPVQQQDLVFLMQSGTQEWRGEVSGRTDDFPDAA